MKNWNFSLREHNDSINMDFETNSVAEVQSKLNDFFCRLVCLPRATYLEIQQREELNLILEKIQENYRITLEEGTDPSKEDYLFELISSFERVIDYVETEL